MKMSQRRSERLQIKREGNAKRKWEQEKEEASNKIIKAVDEFIRIVNRGDGTTGTKDAIKEIRDIVGMRDPATIEWKNYCERMRPSWESDSSEESGAEVIKIDWAPLEASFDKTSFVGAWNPPAYTSPSVAAEQPCSRCGCKDERMCFCC